MCVQHDRAGTVVAGQQGSTGFRVALHNFEGPFDALLHLISKRKLDVTHVALAEVTDEFIAYTRALGEQRSLEEVTEFLVVAATLLDLKAARLLPRGEIDDVDDLELLSRRDLLFARLLQYRAYREVSDIIRELMKSARRSYPRSVAPEAPFLSLLPPLHLGHTPESFARLAASVFRSHPLAEVDSSHVHHSEVSVPEQAGYLLSFFRSRGPGSWLSFAALTEDCRVSLQAVGRFLALLELYKAQACDIRQASALDLLEVRWTGLEVDPAVVAASNWA